MFYTCYRLIRVPIGKLALEPLVKHVSHECDERKPIEVKVDGLGLGDVGEERLGSVGIIEDIVHEDLADDEAGNYHRDVLLAQFNLLIQQLRVVLYFADLVRQLQLAVKTDHVGELSLLEVQKKFLRDPKLA